jgi:phage repressor protein C with HTH and peptisase S24 domain
MHALELPPDLQGAGMRRFVVFGNGMLPLYRHGDQLIVSEVAPIKIGDRVLLQTTGEGTLAGTLIHRDGKVIVISLSGGSRKDHVVTVSEVAFLGRVIWASQ